MDNLALGILTSEEGAGGLMFPYGNDSNQIKISWHKKDEGWGYILNIVIGSCHVQSQIRLKYCKMKGKEYVKASLHSIEAFLRDTLEVVKAETKLENDLQDDYFNAIKEVTNANL